MMNPEVTNTRLRNVIDFEIDYARKAFKKELEEQLAQKDKENQEKLEQQLSQKDKENERLKAILDAHNIAY